ncbi:MAG: hypothetical protein COW84_11870, partial [Gammaproteobacteria bacterium CG22_combo_CG10-13_8_21_14_all_40_8]
SHIESPYHVGFIKPNGFSRDVKIAGNYAYIAASAEGVVIADIAQPSLPIIAKVDTLGIANRIQIVGDKLFVTNMAGDGDLATLNVIDISDPYHPKIIRSIDIQPKRKDYVTDGIYDVEVIGNSAYVSTYYSDQEDQPVKGLVQIIDLGLASQQGVDATIPVITHDKPNTLDVGPRGFAVAQGALQVAAGNQGFETIEMPSLTVIQHKPIADATEVSTEINYISIELSAVLPPATSLKQYFKVFKDDPLIGEDISKDFDINFLIREGEPAYRFIELQLKNNIKLQSGIRYFVIVKAGLNPLTGFPLVSDYSFKFNTSMAGDASSPVFSSISPDQGDIDGGTEITVRGLNFGLEPKIELAGQKLTIKEVIAATAEDPFEKIVATTLPNYAGPAGLQITNDQDLSQTSLGVFTYIDQLRLSFVTPAVVNVSQAGANDRVEIVGYGFNPGVTLKAFISDQPDTVILDVVDNNRLSLYSSERMKWVVPDFGEKFRGFVDLEITDTRGRSAYLSRALFYGHLSINRGLESASPISGKLKDYIPDPGKLPPGAIVDIASDPHLGLIYALGKGVITGDTIKPSNVVDESYIRQQYPPGWISLIHYDRNAIENAAPMFGLGYFNLPQDMVPQAMHLGNKHLYVTTHGYHFPFINTEHEDLSWLLVYDREDRLPGSLDSSNLSKDRDILFKIPLPFDHPADFIDGKDNLLVVASKYDGIAFINVTNPLKPSVVKVIKTASVDGTERRLLVNNIEIINGNLHVQAQYQTGTREGITSGRFIFDIDKPTSPLIAVHSTALNSSVTDSKALLNSNVIAEITSNNPQLVDYSKPLYPQSLGHYQPKGFVVPGSVKELSTSKTLVATTQLIADSRVPICDLYLPIYDVSDPELISIVDVLKLENCIKQTPGDSKLDSDTISFDLTSVNRHYNLDFTEDGLVIATVNYDQEPAKSKLSIIDFETVDFIQSTPFDGEIGVPLNTPIKLVFNRTISIPSSESESAFLSRFLALLLDDGSPDGQLVNYQAHIDHQSPDTIIIEPQANLTAQSQYKIHLNAQKDSRRTIGLLNKNISFKTGSKLGPRILINSITPAILPLEGGLVDVVVKNALAPNFLVADKAASLLSSQPLDATTTRYQIQAPSNFAGFASLTVKDSDGSQQKKTGAIQYVEPLVLQSLSPNSGNVNGGTHVTLHGSGFRPGINDFKILFDGIEAAPSSIKVLDTSTISVLSPSGRLGWVDVELQMNNGQTSTLPHAFQYLQPSQSTISGSGRVIDAQLDPSGNYLFTAMGKQGIAIYDINASRYTGREENPLNIDDLQQMIDEDGDKVDDRIILQLALPDGYSALGIDGYFERLNDRVFVTAAKLDAQGNIQQESAKLFIIAFDSLDITNTTIVNGIELPTTTARGLRVDNNRVLVAMGEAGLGVVDSYLHTKAYVSEQLKLPNNHWALDVETIPTKAEEGSRYAVAAGSFDFAENHLTTGADIDSGAIYIIERNTTSGLHIISSVPLAASNIVVNGNTIYAAMGERGAAIIDVTDPFKPVVQYRFNQLGPIWDVDFSGNTLYLARGAAGLLTVDVTDPKKPILLSGMHSENVNKLEVVVASDLFVVGAGFRAEQHSVQSVVKVFVDVLLKLNSVDPVNHILDKNAENKLQIRLRFNKAIDLWPDNLNRFSLTDKNQQNIPFNLSINNNDAIITLDENNNIQTGDKFYVTAKAGIASVKPITNTTYRVLYRLGQSQTVKLIYRGGRFDAVKIADVVPRRLQLNTPHPVTISTIGVPYNKDNVMVYVGDKLTEITQIESNPDNQRVSIIHVNVPGIGAVGQYDVKVKVKNSNVDQMAIFYGAIVVDSPIKLSSVEPRWGDPKGGSTVLIHGEGFEPGNTVLNGIQLRVGSMPMINIHVISSTLIKAETPTGTPGLHALTAINRYAQESTLPASEGIGYGMNVLATTHPSMIFPTDVYVDQETGVALTSGGYFKDGNTIQLFGNFPFPDNTRAASFDIQDPLNPMLVGGSPALPSGPQAEQQLGDLLLFISLTAKAEKATEGGPPLTLEEQERLENLSVGNVPLSLDSLKIQPVNEMENGVEHKRLYVASGNGG